jgi:hypothetical protein
MSETDPVPVGHKYLLGLMPEVKQLLTGVLMRLLADLDGETVDPETGRKQTQHAAEALAQLLGQDRSTRHD